jgi:M6 family metalloprotease-like protein
VTARRAPPPVLATIAPVTAALLLLTTALLVSASWGGATAAPETAPSAPAAGAVHGLHVCDAPALEALPTEVRAALLGEAAGGSGERAAAGDASSSGYGWQARAARVRRNREDLAAGRITAAEAAARGGTSVTGTYAFPVFPFTYANTGAPPHPPGDIADQLFDGPWPTGTLAEYYEEISYGAFSVDGFVDDWTQLSHNDTYYEGNNWGLGAGGGLIAHEILEARDPAIDFAQWDNDGPDGTPNSGDDDGYVDSVVFLSPEIDGVCDKYKNGICGTVGVANSNLWAHKRDVSFVTDDPSNNPVPNSGGNVRVKGVFLAGGLGCDGQQNGIAVHAHELGHILDLPDLYDTVPGGLNNDSRGLGRWGIMSTGTWNTTHQPSHMIAFCKEQLGWLSYFNVNQDLSQLCVPPVETDPVAVRLWTHGAESQEYFLVENRQPIGFDTHLLGRGFVIYHVDEEVYESEKGSNRANATESHKAIDLECADAYTAQHVANADHLDDLTNCGDATDPWCPLSQTAFNGASVPDSRSYDGQPTEVAVYNIPSCNGGALGEICASFSVGVAFQADLCMVDCPGDGCSEISLCDHWWVSPDLWIDHNNDGIDDLPAQDIVNRLHYRVKNIGPQPIAGAYVDLFLHEPGMGLRWPDGGILITTEVIDEIIPVNGTVERYVDFEYPEPPPNIDHYCIGAMVQHDLDPFNSNYPPNDNNVVQVNHQVLVERAGGDGALQARGDVAPGGDAPGGDAPGILVDCGAFERVSEILIRAPGTYYGRLLEVRLGNPPTFDDWSVPASWTLDFDPGPYLLLPDQDELLVVTMSATQAAHGDTAHVPLTLWDVQAEEAVGGTLLDYRIDCSEPTAPMNELAECVPYHGDDLRGPTVKLSWDPVEIDVAGDDEVIQYYEIYRADDQGNPETLVDEVIIDAEPGEPGFQWYDDVETWSGIVYTYRARGIDGADNAGAFSAPMVADCGPATTAIGEDGRAAPDAATAPRVELYPNTPNPFNPRTTIRFTLSEPGRVDLAVFDLAGRRVRTLAGRAYGAGTWAVAWDGTTDAGAPATSGVYVYRIEVDGRVEARKMMVLK